MTLRSVRLLRGSLVLTASVTLAACGADRPRAGRGTAVDADASSTGDVVGADGAALVGDALPDGEVGAGSDAGCACGSNLFTGCVDLRVDDENCGACGHGCPAEATCNAGVCGPTPTIIEPSRTTACDGLDLVVAGMTLFWADTARGEVLRASATVGAPTPFATLEDRPRALAVGGDEVFWLAGAQSPDGAALPIVPGVAIRAASVGGGPARTVISPAEGVNAFTVTADGRTVYYSTSTRIEKTGATAQTAPIVVVAQARGDFLVGLALDGSTLAFIGELGGDVDAATLVDGQVATCSSVQNFDPASAVLCSPVGRDIAGRTLVAAGGMAYFYDQDMIKQASLTVRFTQSVVANVNGWLTDIAMSSDALFFSESGSPISSFSMATDDGSIVKLPLPAGEQSALSRLARAQKAPASVATDGVRVYWSTADCAIKAVAIR